MPMKREQDNKRRERIKASLSLAGKQKPSARARLDDLRGAISKSQAVRGGGAKESDGRARQMGSGLNLAWRFVGEMIAGIGVGGFIGWWMDEWFSTKPLFLLIMLFLGMIAGLLNALRSIRVMQTKKDK